MATPAVNIIIDKGTSFENSFTVFNDDNSVFNLSGYSAVAKIRKHPASLNYKQFSVSILTGQGKIILSMDPNVTSQLSDGRNYYDIVVTNSATNHVTKVIEGTAIVNPSVSV